MLYGIHTYPDIPLNTYTYYQIHIWNKSHLETFRHTGTGFILLQIKQEDTFITSKDKHKDTPDLASKWWARLARLAPNGDKSWIF